MNAAIAAFNTYTRIAITHYTSTTKYSIATHIRRNSLMRESSLETQLKGFISFSNAVPLDCTPSMRPSILKLVPTYCMIPMHNPLSLSGVYRVVIVIINIWYSIMQFPRCFYLAYSLIHCNPDTFCGF